MAGALRRLSGGERRLAARACERAPTSSGLGEAEADAREPVAEPVPVLVELPPCSSNSVDGESSKRLGESSTRLGESVEAEAVAAERAEEREPIERARSGCLCLRRLGTAAAVDEDAEDMCDTCGCAVRERDRERDSEEGRSAREATELALALGCALTLIRFAADELPAAAAVDVFAAARSSMRFRSSSIFSCTRMGLENIYVIMYSVHVRVLLATINKG